MSKSEGMTTCQALPANAWQSLNWERLESYPYHLTTNVDDVHLAQPVGFVWFRKPRYRVKAISRRRDEQ